MADEPKSPNDTIPQRVSSPGGSAAGHVWVTLPRPIVARPHNHTALMATAHGDIAVLKNMARLKNTAARRDNIARLDEESGDRPQPECWRDKPRSILIASWRG